MTKQDDTGGNINMYMPAGYRGKAERLINILTAMGCELKDKKGSNSTSALFRHLIDKELERLNYEKIVNFQETN